MQVSTTMSEQTYCPNSAEEHPSVTVAQNLASQPLTWRNKF